MVSGSCAAMALAGGGNGARCRARDGATGDIRAVEVTSSQLGDGPVLPDLLAQIPADQAIGTVTAEGAHDTRTCQAAITERGGPAFVGAPVHRTGS